MQMTIINYHKFHKYIIFFKLQLLLVSLADNDMFKMKSRNKGLICSLTTFTIYQCNFFCLISHMLLEAIVYCIRMRQKPGHSFKTRSLKSPGFRSPNFLVRLFMYGVLPS